MKCPKCQTENREARKFCAGCGAKLSLICPECGVENFPGEDFCGECGHPLTLAPQPGPRDLSFDEKIAKIQRYLPEGLTEKILSQRDRIEGERKQVTVMFCDMEGFTQLTEKLGPEEAYAVMDDVYEILIHKVHDYEGTVNEMTGDGIVALFGAPIALEDAPQRAIRSAMAIHREMTRFSDSIRKEKTGLPPLKMRVGIHTGPVVVGTLGNDLRVEFKAVGDTVNLASRMEQLAEPGTTYVTGETFTLTEGLFRFEALGYKEIKGKEEPVSVYQVIASSTRRTRFDVSAERGLTPFVGRERELELLLDGFERAKTGRGQAFSIVAEAGLGKSRLLYEFRKAVTNEDITFLEGKSLSYSKGIAYHPVIDMLKSNFDIREEDGAFEISDKVKAGLELVGADPAATLPYLLELLSVEENGIERIPLSPETRKERIVDALRTIVLRGSEGRPLILTFEDLHWVDKSSEDVFKSLLECIPGARVLLIFTYRPEFVHTWGAKSFHSQITLNRLSNREALAMVTHLLDTDDLDADLEHLILEKTEGVPFFIEEFLKSLKELKIIEKRDSKYQLAKDIQEISIPSTVQDVIMARVDSLPEGAKDLLQIGSAIDREFTYELIKRVAGLPENELLSRLSGLRDSELLYERGIYPQSRYIFKHALTQEVAYNGLLLKTRREIHERIASAIEELYSKRREEHCELLAYHYLRSDNKEKAVAYLELANQKAARNSAMGDAKAYFEQAMELMNGLPDTEENRVRRISLLVKQGPVFNMLMRMEEYYRLLTQYESMAVGMGNPGWLGSLYAQMVLCQFVFGAFDEAVRTSEKAVELCETAGNVEDAVSAYWACQYSLLYTADFERMLTLKDKALQLLGERFDLRCYVRVCCAAANAYTRMGRWEEAEREAREAMRMAQEFSDNSQISFSAWTTCWMLTQKGDIKRAIEYGRLAVEKAPTVADKAWSQSMLGFALGRGGKTQESFEQGMEAMRAFRKGGHVASEHFGLHHLAEAYLGAGRHDEARKETEDLLGLAERCNAKWFLGTAHRLLGEIALKTDSSLAGSHFKEAISLFSGMNSENDVALAYSGMGRFHKQQGNLEEAQKYLTDALEVFERLGTLIEPDRVREELAELPG